MSTDIQFPNQNKNKNVFRAAGRKYEDAIPSHCLVVTNNDRSSKYMSFSSFGHSHKQCNLHSFPPALLVTTLPIVTKTIKKYNGYE
jgi:hypothetical protein